MRAAAAVEQAKDGDLPEIGDYALQENGETGQKITVAEILVKNSEATVGQELTVFGELRDGFAVIDLNSGGDDDV